ncbi:hypothetical protein EYF80_051261 [Liparis tanakae]|uniref:Uncharacterized protein n=1 Tax=Liparis tanakae TaxID=230148 RepID=A0A4Z2FBM5_9TELE|nr:hypothetical protein EYF80_051261 [Liparis tanakae]
MEPETHKQLERVCASAIDPVSRVNNAALIREARMLMSGRVMRDPAVTLTTACSAMVLGLRWRASSRWSTGKLQRWAFSRSTSRRRTCSLYSPTPASPSALGGCWYRAGRCTGAYSAIHLCSLIWATDRRFDGSRTNIRRIRCSQSAGGGRE